MKSQIVLSQFQSLLVHLRHKTVFFFSKKYGSHAIFWLHVLACFPVLEMRTLLLNFCALDTHLHTHAPLQITQLCQHGEKSSKLPTPKLWQ